MKVAQSCPTLCNPMGCRLPGSSVHGIFQARVLEWGAIAFSDWGVYNHKNPQNWKWRTLLQPEEGNTERAGEWWHCLQMTVLVPVAGCSNTNSEDALELSKSKVDLSLIDKIRNQIFWNLFAATGCCRKIETVKEKISAKSRGWEFRSSQASVYT